MTNPKFRLTQNFLEQYEGKQPNWGFGDLSYFTYKRTYSRVKEDGSNEEFFDTVKRVVEGCYQIQLDHCMKNGLPWNGNMAQRSAQKMFQKIWEFKFSPPGRGLWVMGTPIVDKIGSAALNNCAFISTKHISNSDDIAHPFAWACDMLMLGVGVGFDTLGANNDIRICPREGTTTIVIEDTREGWVESVRSLINSFKCPRNQGENGNIIQFDYSKIRPAGSPIKGFGGTASGPDPLKKGHEEITQLLESRVGETLTSTDIVDIMNMIGKFVVAGNVRRSAELAIGSADDLEYVTMKDPQLNSKELMSHRWASNNSIFASPDMDFFEIIPSIHKNGEPGLIFLDNARKFGRLKDGEHDESSPYYDNVAGFNPCAEQSLEHGEMCCLVETYPANHESPEDFQETIKYAYLYAKTVTLLPTHDSLANSVMLRNRRIGLSQSGIQQALKKFGYHTYMTKYADEAYEMVRDWDKTYSRWLGVPTSIKVTTVKPSGTVSILAGATPGVHCSHSRFYMRTVRVAANDKSVKSLLDAGYRIETSVIDYNKFSSLLTADQFNEKFIAVINKETYELIKTSGGTLVVYFPIEENNYTKSKSDISLWEQLYLVRELQNLWSDNSVSCTITFKPEEKNDLATAIRYVAPYVKTLSFLPLEDHSYEQAPYQTIDRDTYLREASKIGKLDLSSFQGKQELKERYCSNDSCTV